ncbi:MAG: putative rane protein [Myxococcales bacterium]|nr:putative rane protein [Myxococcales bacterium]
MRTELGQGVSPRAPGVRLIVYYKATKAVVCLLLALAITLMIVTGYVQRAQMLAAALRADLVNDWAIKLGELALRWLQASRLWWIVLALLGEAVIGGVEALALQRGYRWGAWLVVAATSLLLPVEVIELSHKTTLVRLTIFLGNLAIVWYLLRRAMKEHHAEHPHYPR